MSATDPGGLWVLLPPAHRDQTMLMIDFQDWFTGFGVGLAFALLLVIVARWIYLEEWKRRE